MAIVGFRITELNAKNNEKAASNIEVKSTPKITDIEEIKLSNLENVLKILFDFETKYDPNVGNIKISGYALYQSDDAKKILDSWKKSKALSAKLAENFLNFILRKCLIKITYLADELNLPPVVRFPILKAKRSKEK